MTEEPIGKGAYGDLSQEEASTGSASESWTKKTADFGGGTSKKDLDQRIVEEMRGQVNPEALNAIKKEYKKLKKYSKSNLFTIQKLSGKKTIIDKLVDEYEQNK
tara:strand:- start:110 stop:421 length:312 start_codon:yes stop_codon:yes gene_type:complete